MTKPITHLATPSSAEGSAAFPPPLADQSDDSVLLGAKRFLLHLKTKAEREIAAEETQMQWSN